jgi:WD repeat-containing protein 48
VICAWDLNITASEKQSADLDSFTNASLPVNNSRSQPSTHFRSSVQAHTHWVNDIILTQNNVALVSASSDVSVKLWRPHAQDENTAKTIGVHSDYVKCLGSPPTGEGWVASGGLDHKICLWDLNGAGKKLEIDVGKLHGVTKGSVYALCTNGSILASGGPESVVRLWDPKSGQSITKLVGHTDNVRSILISGDGGTLMTASSDQTVKVWSISAGRCIHTLTMHNDSVWSLCSDHPQLSVFYSSDRSGVVAKTDTRYAAEFDEGLSVALCQEHDGVTKVVAASGHIWTATASSSINRWKDVDTELEIQVPPSPQHSRTTGTVSGSTDTPADSQNGTQLRQGDRANDALIPYTALLLLSVTASYPSFSVREQNQSAAHTSSALRKASEAILDGDIRTILPIRDAPEETIDGQNGLLKHVMLNDRKRVLTVDTVGEVTLWDLIKVCLH